MKILLQLFLLPKFDNSSPSRAYELMMHYLLRQSTQWNLLNEVYVLSKCDDSSFSATENIQMFKLVILQTLSSPNLILILLTLGKSKLILFFFPDFGHSYFAEFGQYIRLQKTIQTHTV